MSATEYPRSMTCLMDSALNSEVNRWVLIDFLLCSKHRLEMSTVPGAVHMEDTDEIYSPSNHHQALRIEACPLTRITAWIGNDSAPILEEVCCKMRVPMYPKISLTK